MKTNLWFIFLLSTLGCTALYAPPKLKTKSLQVSTGKPLPQSSQGGVTAAQLWNLGGDSNSSTQAESDYTADADADDEHETELNLAEDDQSKEPRRLRRALPDHVLFQDKQTTPCLDELISPQSSSATPYDDRKSSGCASPPVARKGSWDSSDNDEGLGTEKIVPPATTAGRASRKRRNAIMQRPHSWDDSDESIPSTQHHWDDSDDDEPKKPL